MSRRVLLRELAHARSGDKGNTSNVAVFVYDSDDYPAVAAQLTAAYLKQEFGQLFTGEVTRYELPELHALNFVLRNALEGGVNESLNLDGHGKSWSSLLLGLSIDIE